MAALKLVRCALSAVALGLVVGVVGCAEEEPAPPKPVDVVVVKYHDWLKDGERTSWALEPGRYKVELSASDDGVTVVWEGCSCPGSATATKSFSVICDMPQAGQLILENPTALGTGPSSSVNAKVTKLAQ